MPDTDEADAAAERYWPEEYKWVIKTDLKQAFEGVIQGAKAFSGIYERDYSDQFESYETFIHHLAEGVAIGAENGIDEILEEIRGDYSVPGPCRKNAFMRFISGPNPLTRN